MHHSISFGNKNTWDDWHLVPSSRPVFNPPSLKKRIIDIPGANGSIDLSESLTRYPVYSNREGSFEFIVMNGYKPWYQTYSDIMDYLHGQNMKAILEDDKGYFYDGRFTVNEWKSNKDWSRIVIDYDVGPYKWANQTSLFRWEWNPFNFNTDMAVERIFKDIIVTDVYSTTTFDSGLFGRAPICPIFNVFTNSGAGMYIRFINNKLGIDITKLLQNGSIQIPEYIMYGDTVSMSFKCVSGNGKVSIDLRRGRL